MNRIDTSPVTFTSSLTNEEVKLAENRVGKKLNPVELAMFDAMWSEHCSYKSSLKALKTLPTKGPNVLVGPGEGGGVVDLGDGGAIVLGIESHNHPSAVDPYNGSATAIGGMLRDILSMGARPIALLNSLRFGPLNADDSQRHKYLLEHVVRGIAGYGNCVGVPTIGGEVEFNSCYAGNPLVNAMCIGYVKKNKLIRSAAQKLGDNLYLIGASTGRDGINGVTFASEDLSHNSEENRGAIQIGDPLTKKIIIDAFLEAVEKNLIDGMQDLGGGGLTCGLSELIARGGFGAKVHLENVHLREDGMSPVEVMISESQERMLVATDPGKEEKLMNHFKKYNLTINKIGTVVEGNMLDITYKGEPIAYIPAALLAEDAPLANRVSKEPIPVKEMQLPSEPTNHSETVKTLLQHQDICCRSWVYNQYDSTVGIRTVVSPGSDSAIIRLENDKYLAVSVDGNGRACGVDPYLSSAALVAESVRNIVCSGAQPLACVDNLNFGNPEDSEVYWQFESSVQGIGDMLRSLNIPVVGGNVSFYNESHKAAIKPTPVIGMIGKIEKTEQIIKSYFSKTNNTIIVAGNVSKNLSGSVYVDAVLNNASYIKPMKNHLEAEKNLLVAMQEISKEKIVSAAHDVSRGGLAIALTEMTFKMNKGCTCTLPANWLAKSNRLDTILFGEDTGRIVISTSEPEKVVSIFKEHNVPAEIIGKVTDTDRVEISSQHHNIVNIGINEAKHLYENALARILE